MLNYLIREPKSSVENPPLIVLLHGYGSDESDLFGFADELPDDYYVVSFRAPYTLNVGGYAWFDLDFSNGLNITDYDQIEISQKLILENIEELKNEIFFDQNNISILGFSQGAILSFSLALNNVDKFKKVLCLSGFPIPELLKNVNMGDDFSNMEFFFSHGKEDVVIPVKWARQFKSISEELDLDYEYHEYYQGHGINSENYYDMLNFLK